MELCKLLPWQATRWLFTHFLYLFVFSGGNRHRKWWNHLKPGMNLRCWHLIHENESWVDNFYQWRSPDSSLCNFQCLTNCRNLLNKMNGFLLVLNIEFCTLLDVYSKAKNNSRNRDMLYQAELLPLPYHNNHLNIQDLGRCNWPRSCPQGGIQVNGALFDIRWPDKRSVFMMTNEEDQTLRPHA